MSRSFTAALGFGLLIATVPLGTEHLGLEYRTARQATSHAASQRRAPPSGLAEQRPDATDRASRSEATAAGLRTTGGVELVAQVGGSVWAVDAEGWRTYAAVGASLVILDTNKPRATQVVGSVLLTEPGEPSRPVSALKAAGSHVYVLHSDDLRIVSLIDPSRPKTIAAMDVGGQDIAVDGRHAYLAHNGGLRILDITDPSAPGVLGDLPLPPTPTSVALAGTYAYVATGRALQVIDVRLPAAPRLERSLRLPASACRVAGDLLYIAGRDAIRILDVSQPAEPQLLGELAALAPADGRTRTLALHLALAEGRLYVARGVDPPTEGNALYVIDVSDPAAPRQLSRTSVWQGTVWNLAAGRNEVFLAAGLAGLLAVDVSDPAAPVQENLHLLGSAQNLAVVESLAYVLRSYGGLAVADVADPASPRLVGQYPTEPLAESDGTYPVSIAVTGRYTLVLDGGGELAVFDTTAATEPRLISTLLLHTNGFPIDMAVQNGFAFVTVAGREGELLVVNISDPARLMEVGRLSLANPASGIELHGPYAYLVTTRAIEVVDVSLPESPRPIGSLALPQALSPDFGGGDLVVAEDYIYVVTTDGRPTHTPSQLLVVRATSPTQLHLAGSVELPGSSTERTLLPRVAVSGHYVCVAAWHYGLQIVDATRPEQPAIVAQYAPAALAEGVRGVAVVGDYVLAAAADQGLLVFRLLLTPPLPSATLPATPAANASRLFLPRVEGGRPQS